MVSRLRRDPATVLPSWVAEFDPGAWAHSGGFPAWRTAVRHWCTDNRLRNSDIESWLSVFGNVSRVRHLLASEAQPTTETTTESKEAR